jgi:hypothetical protein
MLALTLELPHNAVLEAAYLYDGKVRKIVAQDPSNSFIRVRFDTVMVSGEQYHVQGAFSPTEDLDKEIDTLAEKAYKLFSDMEEKSTECHIIPPQ